MVANDPKSGQVTTWQPKQSTGVPQDTSKKTQGGLKITSGGPEEGQEGPKRVPQMGPDGTNMGLNRGKVYQELVNIVST